MTPGHLAQPGRFAADPRPIRGSSASGRSDPDEAPLYPANVTVLEPGKVIMVETAKKTIQKVRKAGVEVIDIPFGEALMAGGGIDCATLQMVRDRGPKLADIK